MRHQKLPRTAGGMRLRTLREACGKTQFEVELDASLGIGYLQRLELGKVQQPERETLERILDAMKASYRERHEVFALFGYALPVSMPDAAETQWAIEVFRAEIAPAAMPAYLLDCFHRLLAWNAFVPTLLQGLEHSAKTRLIPELIFDTVDGFAGNVLNADTFFPAQIRIMQYERQRCGDEAWLGDFIDRMRRFTVFERYWDAQAASAQQVPMRPLAPLALDIGRGVEHFRLISETFAHDPRFRVIYYLPADAATMGRYAG